MRYSKSLEKNGYFDIMEMLSWKLENFGFKFKVLTTSSVHEQEIGPYDHSYSSVVRHYKVCLAFSRIVFLVSRKNFKYKFFMGFQFTALGSG